MQQRFGHCEQSPAGLACWSRLLHAPQVWRLLELGEQALQPPVETALVGGLPHVLNWGEWEEAETAIEVDELLCLHSSFDEEETSGGQNVHENAFALLPNMMPPLMLHHKAKVLHPQAQANGGISRIPTIALIQTRTAGRTMRSNTTTNATRPLQIALKQDFAHDSR